MLEIMMPKKRLEHVFCIFLFAFIVIGLVTSQMFLLLFKFRTTAQMSKRCYCNGTLTEHGVHENGTLEF